MNAKSSLKPSQCQLLELLQSLSFGRIENLQVKGGEPVFSPAPRVVQSLKLVGENSPRPEISLKDFNLKRSITELFRTLEAIGDGEVRIIEIRHGLPHLVEVELKLDRCGSDGQVLE